MSDQKRLLCVFALLGWVSFAVPALPDDFIVNGDFEGTWTGPDGCDDFVPEGWTKEGGCQSGDDPDIGPISDNGPSAPGASACHWIRVTTSSTGNNVDLHQYWDPGIPPEAGLVLSLDVKVISHNLEAGGSVTPATEWPVAVRLYYRRASDPNQTQAWVHGFYTDPPGDGARIVDPGTGLLAEYEDTEVPAGVWTTHVFDLNAELPDFGEIYSIAVGGHGWAYEGQVDNVALYASPCEASPTSLDFGTAVVGDYRDETFRITNVGEETLDGNVSEVCDHYSIVSGSGPYSLAPGEWVEVTVRFEPESPGQHNCTIETGNGTCFDVSCTGVGSRPTIHVCWDGSGDYPTIQDGINAADDGYEVVVCDGTYTGPSNTNLDFYGMPIIVRSESGDSNACIIDCQGDLNNPARGFYFHSGETDTSIVDGFTIRNGYVTSESPGGEYGGGIYLSDSSPTITNCTIGGNYAGNYSGHSGGGMYCNNSSPTIANCTIIDNFVEYYGGGVHCGAGSNPTITNCTIRYNRGGFSSGGGVSCYDSSPTITNCTFSDNYATYDGGGVYCWDSSPTITTCTFSGNYATRGGGVCCWGSSPTITNCILWDDTPDDVYVISGSPIVTYCDVEGGWSGAGNIDSDPLFVDPDNDTYRIGAGSPCIDAGDNNAVPSGVTTDLGGDPRFVDDFETPDTGNGTPPIVDMGAYEYQYDPCAGQVLGDTNCDGGLDCDDMDPFVLAIVDLEQYNIVFAPCMWQCTCDMNGDGSMDLLDIEPFLDAFPDTDEDGFIDCLDNCVNVYNPGQEDSDGDNLGDACEPPGCIVQPRGDTNGDGSINGLDVDVFVDALTDPDQYDANHAPLMWVCTADINCDGSMNGLDIDSFVQCLTGGCPPCP